VLNTPVQFGVSTGSETNGFTDTNQVILWDDQLFAPTDLYGFSALGTTGGTTNVTAGVKTSTGDDATGAQGWVVTAASTGARWTMDFDAANLNGINLYGCQFQHVGSMELDSAVVSCINTLFVDGGQAQVSNAEILRCSIIDANTADGTAALVTDDLGDIVFTSFEFSDGHAIEGTSTGTFASKGNLFTGYGADDTNDAAFYNNSGGDITINVLSTVTGDSPTVRTSTNTTVQNTVTLRVTVTDASGDPIANAQTAIFATSSGGGVSIGDELLDGSGGIDTTTAGIAQNTGFNYAVDLNVDVRVRKSSPSTQDPDPRYLPFNQGTQVTSAGLNLPVTLTQDTIPPN
jgi:hypothetical protein